MRKIKRRKTSLVITLLILVFFISIGYASISTTLNVNGAATIKKYSGAENNSIKVTFDANGGTSEVNYKYIEPDSQYGELPIPTNEGYTFLGWKTSNNNSELPNEYQEVEYIESKGTQYIDTGVDAMGSIGFSIKFKTNDEISNDNYGCIFGGRANRIVKEYQLTTFNDTSTGTFRYNSSSNNAYINTQEINEISYLNNNFKANNNNENVNQSTFYSENHIYAFALNDNGTVTQFGKLKLYNFKLYNNDTLIRNFIPCYRKIDDVIGLYDMVNGEFYTNQGSGTFDKGDNIDYITSTTQLIKNENHTLYASWGHNPTVTFETNGGTISSNKKTYAYNSKYIDLPIPTKEGYTFLGWNSDSITSELPNEYQPVEYIQNIGNLYIDTGYIPNYNNNINIFITATPTVLNNRYCLLSNYDCEKHLSLEISTSGQGRLYYNTGKVDIKIGKYLLNRINSFNYEFDSIEKKCKLDVNESTTTGKMNASGTSNSSMLLFVDQNKRYTTFSNPIKIYKLRISENGNILRNMIPCYRKIDNTIGMYDIENNTFYTKQGDGTLTKGINIDYITDITQMITNEDHTLYAKWEENE